MISKTHPEFSFPTGGHLLPRDNNCLVQRVERSYVGLVRGPRAKGNAGRGTGDASKYSDPTSPEAGYFLTS